MRDDVDAEVPFHSRAIPTVPLGHPDFVYYPAADTDVQRTWRKFGWTPIVREEEK
jgi:hypothetical protein